MTDYLYFDERVEDVFHGWFSLAKEADAAEAIPVLEVWFGSVIIGLRERTIPRPDADAVATGRGDTPKGFAVSLGALYALADMCKLSGEAGVVLALDHKRVAAAATDLEPRLVDPSSVRTLRSSIPGGVLPLADLWFADSHDLRLRFSATGPALSLRFFQPVLDDTSSIRLDFIHEATRDAESEQIVDVPLVNPLLPLLIVAVDSLDGIVIADLLPFPSLCRGGMHAAELAAIGPTGDCLADLRQVGDSLLAEWIGRRETDRLPCIGEIGIDAESATGAEPIFSLAALRWMRGFAGVSVHLNGEDRRLSRDAGDSGAVDHLKERIARIPVGQRPCQSGARLDLSPKALPTLSSIVSRRLWTADQPPRGGNTKGAAIDSRERPSCAGAMIVCEPKLGAPRWFVRPAPDLEGLDRLQPTGHMSVFPRLRTRAGASLLSSAKGMPLAITIREPMPSAPMVLLYPKAPDSDEPILVSSANQAPGISVLVTLRNRVDEFETFVNAVAAQDYAGPVEVIVVDAGSHRFLGHRISAALAATFGGRHLLIWSEAPYNHSAQINLAATKAKHPLLLVANSGLILHDRRTMSVLAELAQWPTAGSASCLLLNRAGAAGRDVAARSAGYLPGRIDFIGSPNAEVVEFDVNALLGPQTYAVVANTLDLAMIRRETWESVGGLDEHRFPSSRGDIDLGVRLIETGFANIVCTGVSASCDVRSAHAPVVDVHANLLEDPRRLFDAFERSIVVRRL